MTNDAPADPPRRVANASRIPLRDGSARFAVIGDSGTGGSAQYQLAARLVAAHAVFPFEFVMMTGDNMYGSEGARDYETKFSLPYEPLLDAKVKFYASLGNHDDTSQIHYEPFNMGGKQFYTFKPKPDLRFFALDTNYLTPEQLAWLRTEPKRVEVEDRLLSPPDVLGRPSWLESGGRPAARWARTSSVRSRLLALSGADGAVLPQPTIANRGWPPGQPRYVPVFIKIEATRFDPASRSDGAAARC